MRNIVLIAAAVALSACAQEGEETPAPAETTDAAAAPAETSAAVENAGTSALAGADAAGSYMVTWADGTTTTTVIDADGTYVDMMDGQETAHGTWAVKDGRSCLTPEGGAELCWTDSEPAADGSWTATADDGTTVTVVKTPGVSG